MAGLLLALMEASAGEHSSGSSLDGALPALDPEVDADKGTTPTRAQTKRRVRSKTATAKDAEPVKGPVKEADPEAQDRKRAADARIKALSERLRKEREERARKRERERKRKCAGKGGGGKGR